MNKRIASALGMLLGALVLHGAGWWLRYRFGWAGSSVLLLVSALLVVWFSIVVLRRVDSHSRPAPMD